VVMRVLRCALRDGAIVLGCAAAFGCKPNIEGRPSLVDRSRVLAVQSSPAEQGPGDEAGVDYRALYAVADDDGDPSTVQWSFCNVRKEIAVIGPAALECLVPAGKALDPIGKGPEVHAVIDKDDCSVFGPSPPTPKEGEPASRPADPDTTGGYYQPVRVLVPTHDEPDYVVGVTRLACGLSGATQDQSIEYADRYRPNENPAIAELEVTHANGKKETFPVGDDVPTVKVSPHERITLRATWAACPKSSTCGDGICGASEYAMDRTVMRQNVPGCPDDCATPKGCTGSEPYVELDPVQRDIISHREAMRVSWFGTDGSFDHDRTGRTEEEAGDAFSENDWVAGGAKGPVHMWVVLRDDRGGVGWTELSVDVGS
jgi:hypothetical protein